MIYDGYGNEVNTNSTITVSDDSEVFDIKNILISKGVKVDCNDGIYYPNPMTFQVYIHNVIFYDKDNNVMFLKDENGNNVSATTQHGTLGYFYVGERCTFEIEGLKVTYKLYVNEERFYANLPSNVYVYYFTDIPVKMKADYNFSLNTMSKEPISSDLLSVKYDEENCVGLLEQFSEKTLNDIISSFETKAEIARRLKSETIWEMNHSRDAFRIATFNIYSAGHAQENWDCVREMLQNYGIDIVGTQETRDPLGTIEGNKVLEDEMKSWQFNYFSTNGELYPTNTRSLMSRFPVLSSYEWEFKKWSSDRRFCAKYEVKLPRYKDRVGSDNIKLSIYNTQLEVYPTPADGGSVTSTNRISEANEIISEVAKDTNPFIILVMDSNDFSADKEIWRMFEDAGFTHCIPIDTNTVTALDNSIDQIFINDRMECLGYDVINGNDYKFVKASGLTMVSDHDLCFADVKFNYDFACIKQELADGYTSDCDIDWIEKGQSLTIRLNKTPSKITVRVRDIQYNNYHSNGVITIPNVNGDVLIRVES